MGWDDPYFQAVARRSRALVAGCGIIFGFIGLLLLAMALASARPPPFHTRAAFGVVGVALQLYGGDLLWRAVRPRPAGTTLWGYAGGGRLLGAAALCSMLVGVGTYGVVRDRAVSGGVIAGVGLLGIIGLVAALLRRGRATPSIAPRARARSSQDREERDQRGALVGEQVHAERVPGDRTGPEQATAIVGSQPRW